MRRKLESGLDDKLYLARRGSTDSELLFLLALQNGLDDDPRNALVATIRDIETLAVANGLDPLVRFTAALSDGNSLYAIRYSSDAISPTLYMSGNLSGEGTCLVSEPLDDEGANWHEISPNMFVEVCGKKVSTSPFMTSEQSRPIGVVPANRESAGLTA